MMKISVVVPTYNVERYLETTLQSVLSQTFTDWEAVIVDDGSSDGTFALARDYAAKDKRIHALSQPNGGAASARNAGLAATRSSTYVAFLDADDVWESRALEKLAAILDAQPEAVAANGLSRYIDIDGEPFAPGALETWGRSRQGVGGGRLVALAPREPTTLGILAYRNCMYTPGQALIRRAVLEKVGGFDTNTLPCEDWDMWLNLSRHGSILFLDTVVLNYRRHGGNVSLNHERMAQGQSYVRRKWLAARELSREQRRTVWLANRIWGQHACLTQIRWTRDRLAAGQRVAAAQLLCHALTSYVQALRGVPVS